MPIKNELHLDKIQFSWLTAIAVLSGSIWRLPFGILTDRVGGRRLFIALLLATAIPCFFVSRATTFGGLLVCALLLGVAGNSFSVGIAWNAAWASRQKQGFALGTFGAGNVGASVTKLIGPALITLVPAAGLLGGRIPGGWRIVPVLYAALLLVIAAVVWIARAGARPHAGLGTPAARDARAAASGAHLAVRSLLRRGLRRLRRVLALAAELLQERLSPVAGQERAAHRVLHLPGQLAAPGRRLALGSLRRARRSPTPSSSSCCSRR